MVRTDDIEKDREREGLEDLLTAEVPAHVLCHHNPEKIPDRGTPGERELDEFIRVPVLHRFKEEPEQHRVLGNRRKVLPKERLFLNQDPDDRDRIRPRLLHRVAAVGLPDIAVPFFKRHPVAVARGERLIRPVVREVNEEEILAVKPLIDMVARKGAEHHFFLRVPEPLRNEFGPAPDGIRPEVPAEGRETA